MFVKLLLPPYPPGALGRGRVKEVLAWSIAGSASVGQERTSLRSDLFLGTDLPLPTGRRR